MGVMGTPGQPGSPGPAGVPGSPGEKGRTLVTPEKPVYVLMSLGKFSNGCRSHFISRGRGKKLGR